ncbi:MAG: thiamine diphosphokinase [Collinsella sp.]|nr:thiamine diphosphokinase [Collinsella sp.]
MVALVVGGSPEVPDAGLLRTLHGLANVVVAVDRGLDCLMAAGLPCDLFCGDADSVSGPGAQLVGEAQMGRGGAFEVERYDPHKDLTDLALALDAIRARWGQVDIVATALSGGSPDHFLAALGRLLSWEGDVRIAERGFEGRVLRAGSRWDLSGFQGSRFSFVPITCDAVVSESDMRWELDHEPVGFLSDLGISNRLDGARSSIECHEGTLMAWVFPDA